MIGSIWLYALPVLVFVVGVWILRLVLGTLMTAMKLAAVGAVVVFVLSIGGVEISSLVQRLI